MTHLSAEEIQQKLKEAGKLVSVGSHYTHYKSNDHVYLVTGFGVDEDTEEVRVEYQRIDENPPIKWRRRLEGEDGWLTPVEVNGTYLPRFKKVD
jgi:hypothetical protein